MKRLLLAAIVSSAVLLATTTPAIASEPALDPDIVRAIDAVPGGVLVDESTVEWPSLGMTFTLGSAAVSRSIGSCPTNYICAFSGSDLSGNKLSFAGCSTWSTAPLGTGVKSIANARTSGYVYGRNAAGTNIAYAGYDTWTNTASGISKLVCGGDGITF